MARPESTVMCRFAFYRHARMEVERGFWHKRIQTTTVWGGPNGRFWSDWWLTYDPVQKPVSRRAGILIDLYVRTWCNRKFSCFHALRATQNFINQSQIWKNCMGLLYGDFVWAPLVIPKASVLLGPCTPDWFSTIALGKHYGTVAVWCTDLYSYKSLRDYKWLPPNLLLGPPHTVANYAKNGWKWAGPLTCTPIYFLYARLWAKKISQCYSQHAWL